MLRAFFIAVLSGENPEKIVEGIDEKFIEKIILGAGGPKNVFRRVGLLVDELSKYEEFNAVAVNFLNFITLVITKVLEVYQKLLNEAWGLVDKNIEQIALIILSHPQPACSCQRFHGDLR